MIALTSSVAGSERVAAPRRRRGADWNAGAPATANVVAVNAIVTREMRAAHPEKPYATFTDADDVAAALAYLCTDGAGAMNGRRVILHP